MSRSDYPHLERFLAGLHRRMVALRVAEGLGLGVLAAAGAALLLVPVLVWRGRATMDIVTLCLALGAVAGLAWGILRRPTRLAAAVEADRQLRAADLFGTALLLLRSRGPATAPTDVERAVLAAAQARCARLGPSAVAVNRLGARSWGGIALAVALAVVLGVLGGEGDRGRAMASAGAGRPRSWTDTDIPAPLPGDNRTSLGGADTRRPPEGTGGDADPPSPQDSDPQPTSATGQATGSSDSTGDATGGTGAGAGAALTKPTPGGTAPDPRSNSNDADAGTPKTGTARTPGGATGGGTGAASDPATATTGNAGGSGGTSTGPRRPAPPWRAGTWAADQDAARDALRAGRIPDRYRDLVRDYFERS